MVGKAWTVLLYSESGINMFPPDIEMHPSFVSIVPPIRVIFQRSDVKHLLRIFSPTQ